MLKNMFFPACRYELRYKFAERIRTDVFYLKNAEIQFQTESQFRNFKGSAAC